MVGGMVGGEGKTTTARHGRQGVPDTRHKPGLNKNPKTKHYERAGGIVFIDITPGGKLTKNGQIYRKS